MPTVLRRSSSILAVALVAVPGAARADNFDNGGAAPIVVTGERVQEPEVSGTKTGTPLIDTPQSVVTLGRERLNDQGVEQLGDALRYVPGVTLSLGEGNRDQVVLRGQPTTADFYLDGLRDDAQYYRPLYNTERVEVLKGSNALLFGRGGGGGIINRVLKAPSADRFFAGGAAGVNTLGAWDIAADVNAPLGSKAAVRINADYERLDSHRDFVDGERYAVNPHIAADFGGGWKAGLSYEYVHDDRVADRGIPSLACTAPCQPGPLPGHRDTFFGVPGTNGTGLEAHIVKARLDGQLTDTLNWTSSVLYGDYDKYYTNVYANGAATAANGTVALASYTDPTKRRNFIAQSNLVWDLNLGAIANKILLGLEYGDQHSVNQRLGGVLSSGTLNLANIVYPTVSFPALNRNTSSDVRVFSAYAQDQISFGAHLDVVVGLRFDRFKIRGTDHIPTVPRPFARTDEKLSPRFGLIFKPQENVSIYASYSKSFLPRAGDQFLTLTTTQENLAPEQFTNYEVGAKWDIRPDLNVTLALFQLDRTNATTRNPANITQEIVIGKTRTKGVEFAVTGRITPDWQISGGYTYQDAKVAGTDLVRLPQVPEHQFALWNRYDVTRRFGAGIGVVHQSSQFAALRTSLTALPTRLPGFTRVDAALFFTASDRLQFQVNVENLLDTTYFSDAHNNNNITPGAPINARFTARVKF